MFRLITTVSTKGQLVIPSEMRASLGIEPGSRIAITLDQTRIILEPISKELVERTRGMFFGKPSLTAELARQRRQKDKW